VAVVRKRTIPTERPALVGEVSANLCLGFLDRRDVGIINYNFIVTLNYNISLLNQVVIYIGPNYVITVGGHVYITTFSRVVLSRSDTTAQSSKLCHLN
jgi:hypothetical protein